MLALGRANEQWYFGVNVALLHCQWRVHMYLPLQTGQHCPSVKESHSHEGLSHCTGLHSTIPSLHRHSRQFSRLTVWPSVNVEFPISHRKAVAAKRQTLYNLLIIMYKLLLVVVIILGSLLSVLCYYQLESIILIYIMYFFIFFLTYTQKNKGDPWVITLNDILWENSRHFFINVCSFHSLDLLFLWD